jgi:hypothetical protein
MEAIMQRKPARRISDFGTHMTRAPDDTMAHPYEKGDWLGVARCWRPKEGRDVIFVNECGNMIVGEVMGWSADTWRIGQFHGQPRYTVRRLSRLRWRPASRIMLRNCVDDGYYGAVALGLTDRAKTIQPAIGNLCDMPPPLTSEQHSAVPRVVKMSP